MFFVFIDLYVFKIVLGIKGDILIILKCWLEWIIVFCMLLKDSEWKYIMCFLLEIKDLGERIVFYLF